jgi:hypothetical protein
MLQATSDYTAKGAVEVALEEVHPEYPPDPQT